MRTKTLLLTAALTAAGALTSMAQVYSVNVVGYINLNIPLGFSLVANQLNNTPDNTIKTLFPAPPGGTVAYKFNGGGFDSEVYDAGLAAWSGGGAIIANPGDGLFLFAKSAFTATFVGEVQLTSTRNIPTGFSIVSSVIPQAGNLYNPTNGANADLFFGLPQNNEVIYQFNGAYTSAVWDGGLQKWQSAPTLAGPALAVGESFFNFTPPASGIHAWNRTFTVGP